MDCVKFTLLKKSRKWIKAAQVTGILKLAEKKSVRLSTVTASLLMPILLPVFMVDFFAYVCKKDFSSLTFQKNFLRAVKFMLIEIQLAPLIHTTLIEMFSCTQKESGLKIVFPIFQKNTFVRSAVEDLRLRVSYANKIV